METSDPRVGAHQAHLRGGAIRGPIACSECHVVPSSIHDHIDGNASPVFGPLASARGAAPAFSRATGECAGTYCHGASLAAGGTLDAPVWTTVDGTQAACGTCHGTPPPQPHPQVASCDLCHADTVRPDGTIDIAGGQHIDGTLDGGGACGACHPVPPQSGAHRAHYGDTSSPPLASYGDLRIRKEYAPAGDVRYAFGCGHCHPLDPDRHGQREVDLSPVGAPLGSLKARNAAGAAYDAASGTCSGVYCHSNGKQRVEALSFRTAPPWASTASLDCTGCHANPPLPPHPQVSSCNGCHPDTVRADGTIDFPRGEHVDGTLDGGACGSCHPVPPQSGAHRAHYGDVSSPPLAAYGDLRIFEDFAPADASAYAFGCGHCHPLDPERHTLGEVDLSPAGAPAGSLKARNASGAAYDAASGTCSGVYCHSTGQANPAFAVAPAWTSGAALGCDGCHQNPPAYPSGGPGAPDANTHLQLDSDGWETGHFAGLPGPWHSSKHGGDAWGEWQQASPITCQTCHYETTDPAATGPSGFYWLNTTGNYAIAGGMLGYDCDSCHAAADPAAPTGAGGVLPLRHVNGRRDLVFDPRLALPPYATLPAAPFTPSRPIFVTDAAISTIGPDAVREPSPIPPPPPGGWPYAAETLSMHLASARYDPSTKTCSSVSCHLAQTTVQWGGPTGWDACGACHGFSFE